MGMVTCKECGKEVSDQAKACPHCGVDNPGSSCADTLAGLIVLALIAAVLLWWLWPESEEPELSPEQHAAQEAACRQDFDCWRQKHQGDGVFCVEQIEKQARWGYEWTDAWYEPKFELIRWHNQASGSLTYTGDQVRFQNSYGAWQNMVYECDIDPVTDQVLGVRVRPGRL